MTLVKDDKGRLRHKKPLMVGAPVLCEKCGYEALLSRRTLRAVKVDKHNTKYLCVKCYPEVYPQAVVL